MQRECEIRGSSIAFEIKPHEVLQLCIIQEKKKKKKKRKKGKVRKGKRKGREITPCVK